MTASGDGRKTTATPPGQPEAGAGGAIPEDEQRLQEEIKQTREQLADTVEQLVAKTDVKARARAKAAELTGRLKDSTAQVRTKAVDRGAGVRGQVAGKTVMARQKAASVGGTAPEPVRRTAVRAANIAKQRRLPLMAATASLIAGFLVLRWWRRR
jgi:Protein of unknown function (DUF3618)